MRSLRYLNSILTVLAVLLTLNLWTAWTTTPGGEALAVSREAHADGIPNAANQRKEMVDLLKQINVQLSDLKTLLRSGDLQVKIEAPAGEGQGQ